MVDAHLGLFPTFHLPLVLGLAGELTLEELKESPEEVREQLKEVAGTEDVSADTLRREKNTCKNRVADCCLTSLNTNPTTKPTDLNFGFVENTFSFEWLQDIEGLFQMLDYDGGGSLDTDEFCEGLDLRNWLMVIGCDVQFPWLRHLESFN